MTALSQQYGMSLQDFASLNNLTDLDHFQAGSTFLVKDSGDKATSKAGKPTTAGGSKNTPAQSTKSKSADGVKKATTAKKAPETVVITYKFGTASAVVNGKEYKYHSGGISFSPASRRNDAIAGLKKKITADVGKNVKFIMGV